MTTTTELDASPDLLRLYAQAPVTGLRGGDDLPDEELLLRDVAIERDRLAAYARVCGMRFGEVLPATYLHVLAFPLAVRLMAEPRFPFALPGLVHVGNRIDQHRPVTAAERPTLRVRTERLRPHRKGRQFDVVAEAEVDGERVWTDVSTYLHREKGGGAGDGDEAGDGERDGDAGASTGRDAASRVDREIEVSPAAAGATWRVPADTGRRYAAVSGDRNPIHLSALTARAFGFPRAIAHGMWTAARALGALEGRLPAAFSYGVRFHKPLLLPATVTYTAQPDEDGDWLVGVHSRRSGQPHLTGIVAAAG